MRAVTVPVRVVVADDNPVVRFGVRAVLADHPAVALVGEAADGPAALELARRLRPDVVLLDARMHGGDGLPVVAPVSRYARVVMLSAADDAATVAGAIGAGATSYLVHGSYQVAELVGAVLDAAVGRPSASPAAATALVAAVRRAPGTRAGALPAVAALSTREREVLGLVADGLPNDAIGRRLGLTEKTVKNHLQRVYDKLGVHSRSAALSVWLGVADPGGVG